MVKQVYCNKNIFINVIKKKTGKVAPGWTWSQADERFGDNSEGFHSTIESGHYRTTAESALLLDKQTGEHRSHSFP